MAPLERAQRSGMKITRRRKILKGVAPFLTIGDRPGNPFLQEVITLAIKAFNFGRGFVRIS